MKLSNPFACLTRNRTRELERTKKKKKGQIIGHSKLDQRLLGMSHFLRNI
jgi:hypothetical protein